MIVSSFPNSVLLGLPEAYVPFGDHPTAALILPAGLQNDLFDVPF